MKVIITGSTGMVGKGWLLECIDNLLVESILLVNRQPVGITHSKIREIIPRLFVNQTKTRARKS